nr:hypothetical protein [Escherichia coli]
MFYLECYGDHRDLLKAYRRQRLVRTWCSHCATWHDADDFEKELFKPVSSETMLRLPKPKGCEQCAQTGFTGRTAIYEIETIHDVSSVRCE